MSQTIDWSRVQALSKLYREHPQRIKTLAEEQIETLSGWRVTKQALLDLINQTDQNIEEIFIVPMVKEEDENKPQNEQFFTIALVGIAANQLVTQLAYDFSNGCPARCPDNISDLTNP